MRNLSIDPTSAVRTTTTNTQDERVRIECTQIRAALLIRDVEIHTRVTREREPTTRRTPETHDMRVIQSEENVENKSRNHYKHVIEKHEFVLNITETRRIFLAWAACKPVRSVPSVVLVRLLPVATRWSH